MTLTFFGADYGTGPANSTTKYWDAVAAAFHQANPTITVNVQTVDWTDFPTKVRDADPEQAVSGHPGRQPGAAVRPVRPDLPGADVLSPSVVSNLIPKFLKDGQYQGTDYGIPFTTSTRAMYYNKKIFAAAGISSPPQTWAQLQSRRRQDQGQGLHRLRHAARQRGSTGRTAAVVPRRRRRLPETSGQYAINSPQNVATLDFMKQLAASGDTQPNPGGTDRKTSGPTSPRARSA